MPSPFRAWCITCRSWQDVRYATGSMNELSRRVPAVTVHAQRLACSHSAKFVTSARQWESANVEDGAALEEEGSVAPKPPGRRRGRKGGESA